MLLSVVIPVFNASPRRVDRLTRDYRPVYNHAGYTVYAPRGRATTSGG